MSNIKIKWKAFAVRGFSIVCILGIPPDINASNRDEWIKRQKEIGGYDNIILMNEMDFIRLFW